jgi:hypothetical protein
MKVSEANGPALRNASYSRHYGPDDPRALRAASELAAAEGREQAAS